MEIIKMTNEVYLKVLETGKEMLNEQGVVVRTKKEKVRGTTLAAFSLFGQKYSMISSNEINLKQKLKIAIARLASEEVLKEKHKKKGKYYLCGWNVALEESREHPKLIVCPFLGLPWQQNKGYWSDNEKACTILLKTGNQPFYGNNKAKESI